MYNDDYFMNIALSMAKQAYHENEIPVGAIIVKENKIIASAYNKKDSEKLVTKHAELIAIEKASINLGDWRLNDCTIYVTMEPCPMCAGAIQQARIKRLVYGCSSNIQENSQIINKILNNREYNHQVTIECGILKKACSKLVKDFFKEKR